jgi:hypothetical protein
VLSNDVVTNISEHSLHHSTTADATMQLKIRSCSLADAKTPKKLGCHGMLQPLCKQQLCLLSMEVNKAMTTLTLQHATNNRTEKHAPGKHLRYTTSVPLNHNA